MEVRNAVDFAKAPDAAGVKEVTAHKAPSLGEDVKRIYNLKGQKKAKVVRSNVFFRQD